MFEVNNIQNISPTVDKELGVFISGTPLYVIICRSYKLFYGPFLAHPALSAKCTITISHNGKNLQQLVAVYDRNGFNNLYRTSTQLQSIIALW